MRRILQVLLTCFLIGTSTAAPLTPVARTEIEGLLSRLEASRCEFQRNGTWHSASEAKSHLQGKLRYLEERGAIHSAEQFIERAATRSSMTDQPYLVRCANSAPVPSSAWLLAQLQRMRANPGANGAP